MTRPLVVVSDLRHAYADGQTALHGVSFQVGSGDRLAIVGANGAGKSTTLLHLAGCLLPQAGSVRVADLLLCRENLSQLRRSVGMLFQNPDDQLFMPRVFDDVAFGPVNLGLPADDVQQRVMHALAVVGATHLSHRQPHRLSGGEKRAVAIASVLALSPAVLLMDEPTSSLDPASRRQLIELLQTFEQTLIIATHDLDMVLDLCPRTLVLGEGRIIADGASAVILSDAALLAAARLEQPLRLQACPVCSGAARRPSPPPGR
ncbi:ABC transporter ATP-binding protein [Accumulibacter sp.]|uniref:energy-coupling factor ABC transporter ATP-binding protein n=1 Tax=Accumulibacter sp. TaxID=2053492 RepID=UPI0025D73FE1|nr:ABC transporter ATP-binding protein [Accumulibacter sp.]MCM8611255.1 energy-coupling factor ABC transporter ATP-binding protein [Accumulibacter sp.]MCM8635332.1 energy-coupling factor ABC transporter ATP-binding protein [Accumulibacter sp.]MCM8638737.1 energy-coupling factor ABC transporter ATP-binding protein [Accumulibacter sp.]